MAASSVRRGGLRAMAEACEGRASLRFSKADTTAPKVPCATRQGARGGARGGRQFGLVGAPWVRRGFA
eukprot:633471-Prymnesium_polylepis.1